MVKVYEKKRWKIFHLGCVQKELQRIKHEIKIFDNNIEVRRTER